MEKNKYEVRYLPSNINDLLQILNYITYNLQNPNASERLLNIINETINSRSFNPKSFEKHNRTRNSKYPWYKIHVENYTIFYTVTGNTMELTRILNNRRNFNKLI